MENLPIYILDAFSSKLFGGNPAAVCPLSQWLDDDLMQKIAAENNLSETAFFVPNNDKYELRWFTPSKEVDLCGHATLAAASVIFNHIAPEKNEIKFSSKSGMLIVSKDKNYLVMDFPVLEYEETKPPHEIEKIAIEQNILTYKSRFDLLVVIDSEDSENYLVKLSPDLNLLANLNYRGVIFTGYNKKNNQIYSRCFYPRYGVPEDPVTGSAHCVIAPYWCERLSMNKISAKQGLSRQGELVCEVSGDRVKLYGECQLYSRGEIYFS